MVLLYSFWVVNIYIYTSICVLILTLAIALIFKELEPHAMVLFYLFCPFKYVFHH